MKPTIITRAMAFALAFASAAAIVAQLAVVTDLYGFEYRPLLALLGVRGIVSILLVNAGLIVVLVRAGRALIGRPVSWRVVELMVLGLSAVTVLWMLEWTFIEKPPSVQLQLRMAEARAVPLTGQWAEDFASFSVTARARDAQSRGALETAYARIVVNNADTYRNHPPAMTIDRLAARHDIDPDLLFYILYLDSFYGEATSGPVPFLQRMTSETVRDLIQVHVPGWFIESRARQALVTSPLLVKVFGEGFGFKLRYAFQKANIDVSTQPYGANTLTNILLVLKEYPEQFTDILDARNVDPLQAALRDSFLELRDSTLLPPYEAPYDQAAFPPAYYDEKRDHLKQFSRAAFYLTALDFELATRIQVLLLSYRRDFYRDAIGSQLWNELPRWQQNALLTMVQDVYTPSVGRFGYNLYALPEINNMALAFVAREAAGSKAALGATQQTLWRPEGHEVLWGGAGFQLAVMNEVWSLVNPEPIPGVGIANTLPYAGDIVWLARRRLDGSATEVP